jgi:hypothetical protein
MFVGLTSIPDQIHWILPYCDLDGWIDESNLGCLIMKDEHTFYEFTLAG